MLTSPNPADIALGDLLECAKFFRAFDAVGTESLAAFPIIQNVAFLFAAQECKYRIYASGIFERAAYLI